jgi:hypothetical protein
LDADQANITSAFWATGDGQHRIEHHVERLRAELGVGDVQADRDRTLRRDVFDRCAQAAPLGVVERVPARVVAGRVQEDERAALRAHEA